MSNPSACRAAGRRLGRRDRRRRSCARGDAGLDSLLKVAVLDRELGLPQHDTANVGQVKSRNTVVSREKRAGGNVALVAVGTAGQRTNEEGGVANVLAPVLDGGVEARLADVAVAVVVELDPDVVEQLADVERLGGVRERALGSGSQVVSLAGVLGKVGPEALGHGQVAGGVASLVVYSQDLLANHIRRLLVVVVNSPRSTPSSFTLPKGRSVGVAVPPRKRFQTVSATCWPWASLESVT